MTHRSILAACLALSLIAIPVSAAQAPGTGAPAKAERPPVAIAASASVIGPTGDSYVPKGEVHDGDLVAVFGDARVDGEVTGNVVVVMGSLELSGTVRGDTVAVLSPAHLSDTAKVDGQLVGVGYSIQRDAGSEINGEVVNVGFMNLLPFVGHHGGLSGFLRFLFILHMITLAFLFVVILVITALIPRRLSVMAAAFPVRWGWAFLVGVLTYAGVLIGVVFLAVTIIGIPLAILLGFLAAVVKWIGLAALCYLIGHTVGRNVFGRELPHLACVLGGFVFYSLLTMVPFAGWVFSMVMKILATGLVLVTRFGADPVPSQQPSAMPPQVAPAPLAGGTTPATS